MLKKKIRRSLSFLFYDDPKGKALLQLHQSFPQSLHFLVDIVALPLSLVPFWVLGDLLE